MNPELYLALFLLATSFLLWLGGGGKGSGPPAEILGIMAVLLLTGCPNPKSPFVAPDVGPAPEFGSSCYDYEMRASDHIIGVPHVLRIQYRWDYNWCVRVQSNYLDFEGEWYFVDFETSFSNWDQVNEIVLEVDGRPLAWVTEDRETGFDPTFDVAPYMTFMQNNHKETAETHLTKICLPVTVDMDVYTARQRLDFEYAIVSKVCPSPSWDPEEQ